MSFIELVVNVLDYFMWFWAELKLRCCCC